MTTIAFDGEVMAADMLATDNWGLKDNVSKLLIGKNFVAGGAGDRSKILHWWSSVKSLSFEEILNYGYPDYDSEKNDPSILIAYLNGGVYKHAGGLFMPCSRVFHAVGSGRDYALAAMYLGRSAKESVEIAMIFDNNTGGQIETYRLNHENNC
jgi:hypothetical protein